jgi:N-hydroxyarylamine O-acetyltransferase
MPDDERDDEWGVAGLNVDAYLDRIGHTGDTQVSAATLRALHHAHVTTIPFENLDIVLGRGVSVELADVTRKLVDDRRGGYCYEHASLFAAVLERLGFTVERHLARIGDNPVRPRPRTHMITIVTVLGERWLADVGFGSGLLEPLPLRPDVPVTQWQWTHRLAWEPERGWLLQERGTENRWTTQYTFIEERTHQSDVVMANHFSSTWPRSPFTLRSVVIRKDDRRVRRLHGRILTHERPGEPVEERVLDDAGFAAALHDLGLDLDAVDVETLLARVPVAPR